MTYDAADGYVVLFGGYNTSASTYQSDTWTYSAGVWKQLFPTFSPSPRRGGAITYDAADGYVVLFGGEYSGPTLHDTWKFLAGQWTDITPSVINSTNTPGSRFVPGMAYDEADSSVILFGGCTASGCPTSYGDTWAFTGGNWSQVSVTSGVAPSPRGGPTMVWDGATNSVLLYGGENAGSHLSDTWTYRASTWTLQTTTASPGNRGDSFAVYDPLDHFVVLHGGLLDWSPSSNRPVDDTWVFAQGAWSNVTSKAAATPASRWTNEEAGTFDSADGYGIMFGGRTPSGADLNDTWAWISPLWVNLTPSATSITQSQGIRFNASALGGSFAYSFTYAGLPATCPTNGVTFVCGFNVSGSYDVNLTVRDSAGISGSSSVTVAVAPRFAITLSANRTVAETPAIVGFTSTESGATGPLHYAWAYGDGGVGSGGPASVHTYRSVGNFTPEVTITDALGGIDQASVGVRMVSGLTALVSANRSAGVASLLVHLTGTVMGGLSPNPPRWNFGDGSAAVVGLDQVDHTYVASGTYSTVFSVNDSLGTAANGTLSITVVDPLSATANASTSRTTTASPVDFSTRVSGGLSPIGLSWTFGDGTTGTGPSVTHRYNAPGPYGVALVASDSLGERVQQNLSVLAAFPLTASIVWSVSSEACVGTSPTAYLNLTATTNGGFPPETYSWSTGATTQGFTWTSAAGSSMNVSVSVQDSATEVAAASAVVSSPELTCTGTGTLPSWALIAIAVGVGAAAIGAVVWASQRRRRPGAGLVGASTGASAGTLAASSTVGTPPAGPPPNAAAAGAVAAVDRGPGSVPLGDQILLHLQRQGRLGPDETAPLAFTQEGIAASLGKGQNVFVKTLTRLESTGLIVSSLQHVRGEHRRRKVYRLTPAGETEAARLRSLRPSGVPASGQ